MEALKAIKINQNDGRAVFLCLPNIVDWGGFGQLRNFCNFWTRKLSLNSSYGMGILRQPFRTMSCRKFGSKIMSGFF